MVLVLVPVWTKWCELESGSQEPDPEPPVIILQTRYPPNSDSYNFWAQFSKEQIASLIYKHGSQNIWKNQITGPKTAGSFAIFHGHKAPRFPDLHGQFNKGFLSAPNRAPLLTEFSFLLFSIPTRKFELGIAAHCQWRSTIFFFSICFHMDFNNSSLLMSLSNLI
jgi:hypothetical protein